MIYGRTHHNLKNMTRTFNLKNVIISAAAVYIAPAFFVPAGVRAFKLSKLKIQQPQAVK